MIDQERVLDYLRSNPRVSRQQAMKELGVSARSLRVAEQRLASERGTRSSPGVGLLALGVVALAAGAFGYGFLSVVGSSARGVDIDPTAAEQSHATRRELYQALDQRSAEHSGQAVENLSDPDASVRLAALRYLVTIAPKTHADALLSLVDDPNERVRRAAVQLAAEIPGPGAPDRLLGVADDGKRADAERLLALGGLTKRSGEFAWARLTPLLVDDSAAIRRQTETTLFALVGSRPASVSDDPGAKRQAWEQLLEDRRGK